MKLLELIEEYGKLVYSLGVLSGAKWDRSRDGELKAARLIKQIKEKAAAVDRLCDEAESYVDIGFDHGDESAPLRAAIKTVKA